MSEEVNFQKMFCEARDITLKVDVFNRDTDVFVESDSTADSYEIFIYKKDGIKELCMHHIFYDEYSMYDELYNDLQRGELDGQVVNMDEDIVESVAWEELCIEDGLIEDENE
jgi:hypothetical protein